MDTTMIFAQQNMINWNNQGGGGSGISLPAESLYHMQLASALIALLSVLVVTAIRVWRCQSGYRLWLAPIVCAFKIAFLWLVCMAQFMLVSAFGAFETWYEAGEFGVGTAFGALVAAIVVAVLMVVLNVILMVTLGLISETVDEFGDSKELQKALTIVFEMSPLVLTVVVAVLAFWLM